MPSSPFSFKSLPYCSTCSSAVYSLRHLQRTVNSCSKAPLLPARSTMQAPSINSDKVAQSNDEPVYDQGGRDVVLSYEANTKDADASSEIKNDEGKVDQMFAYIPTPYFGLPFLNLSGAPQTFEDAPVIPANILKRMWFPIRSFGIGPLVTSEVPSDSGDQPVYCRAPVIPCRFTRPPELRMRRAKKDFFLEHVAESQFPKVSFLISGEPISVNMIEHTAETSTALYVDHPMRYLSHVVGLTWYVRRSGETFLVITHTDVMLRPGMSLSCSRRLGDFVLTHRVCNLDGMLLFNALQRSPFGSNIFEKARYICVPRQFLHSDVDGVISPVGRAEELSRLRSIWYRIPEGFEARQLDRSCLEFGFPAEQIGRQIGRVF
ncbi:hypothetical protein BDZ89DRAFT_1045308 [Hymenopellis radicata]|nr:hypothetical protein BDZ89DRAFT_1045308 [Hymenopellis radicata]